MRSQDSCEWISHVWLYCLEYCMHKYKMGKHRAALLYGLHDDAEGDA